MAVLTFGLIAAMAVPVLAADAAGGETTVLSTPKDRASYAVGVETVRNFKRLDIEVDPDMVVKGMKDAMSGNKLLMTDTEIQGTVGEVYSQVRRKQAQEKSVDAKDNKKEGAAFLAANKAKEGVVTLPSGLQYKVLKAGDGKVPTDADTVQINYRGTLVDGTEFDNSEVAEQPASISLSDIRVITGLKQALKLMPVGSKWQLFIPSRLAYQYRGWGKVVGPDATLIYEVELIGIERKADAQ